VFQKMNQAGCSTVPVEKGGRLVGLLTLENVGEYIMVSSAERGRVAARSAFESAGAKRPRGRGDDDSGRVVP